MRKFTKVLLLFGAVFLVFCAACKKPSGYVVQDVNWGLKETNIIEVGKESILPEYATVTFKNKKTEDVKINWDGGYDNNIPGEYDVVGEIAGDIVFEENSERTYTAKIFVGDIIELISQLPFTEYESREGERLNLPTEGDVVYVGGRRGKAPIIWDTTQIDVNMCGDYKSTGIIQGFFRNDLSNTVSIKVKIVPMPEVLSVTPFSNVELNFKKRFSLPDKIEVVFEGGTEGQVDINWKDSQGNVVTKFLADKEGLVIFTGTVNKYTGTVTFKINVVKNITSITTHVPDKRVEISDEHNLPTAVTVEYKGGESGEENVVWNDGEYNKGQAGLYLIEGTVGSLKILVNVYVGNVIIEADIVGGIENTYYSFVGEDYQKVLPKKIKVKYFGKQEEFLLDILWSKKDSDDFGSVGSYIVTCAVDAAVIPDLEDKVNLTVTLDILEKLKTVQNVVFEPLTGIISWSEENDRINIEKYIFKFVKNGVAGTLEITDVLQSEINLSNFAPGKYSEFSITTVGKSHYNSPNLLIEAEYSVALKSVSEGNIERKGAGGVMIAWKDSNLKDYVFGYQINIKLGTEVKTFNVNTNSCTVNIDELSGVGAYKVFVIVIAAENYINSIEFELLQFNLIVPENIAADGRSGKLSWEGAAAEAYLNGLTENMYIVDTASGGYVILQKLAAGNYSLSILAADGENNSFGILAQIEYTVSMLGAVSDITNNIIECRLNWTAVIGASGYELIFEDKNRPAEKLIFTAAENFIKIGESDNNIAAGKYNVSVKALSDWHQYLPALSETIYTDLIVSGDGSAQKSAFIVHDRESLINISDKNYCLVTENFSISENISAPTFGGIFDGNNKTISGLNNPLISILTGSVINLTLEVAIIAAEGENAIGAIASSIMPSEKSVISGCTVKGSIVADASGEIMAGGIAGVAGSQEASQNDNKYIVIENCYNYASIKTVAGETGGIVGRLNDIKAAADNDYAIRDCANFGNITSTQTVAGIAGIAGVNRSGIKDCWNDGEINGAEYAGGIAGKNYSTIIYCYTGKNSTVSGDVYVGGITGYHESSSNLSYNFNAGKVTGKSSTGGICGEMAKDSLRTINNSFNLGDIESLDNKTVAAILGDRKASGAGFERVPILSNVYNAGKLVSADKLIKAYAITGSRNDIIKNAFSIGEHKTPEVSKSPVNYFPNSTVATIMNTSAGAKILEDKYAFLSSNWAENRTEKGGAISGYVVLKFMTDQDGVLLERYRFINNL